MTRLSKFSIILFIGFCFVTYNFSQDKKENKQEIKKEVKKEIEKKEVKTTVAKAFNTVCPVSGEEIDEKITSTYEGKTYAFCCKKCKGKFEKEPTKYSKNLSEDGTKFQKQ